MTGDQTSTKPEATVARTAESLYPAAHIWLLFSMWCRPRLVTGFFTTTAALLLIRLVCSPFDPVPGEIHFMPLFLLCPAAAVVFGPAGVWAAVAASLLGDFLCGPWTGIAWFRAAGALASSMHVFALWDSSFLRRQPSLFLVPSWRLVIRFVMLAVPAGLIASVWDGLGVELLGSHPFGHAAAMEGAQILFFGTLLAPVFFRTAARDIAGHLGDWHSSAGQAGRWAHWRPAGLLAACPAAASTWIFGVLFSSKLTGSPPWQPAHLGQIAGGGLPELVAGLLAFHLAVIFWPD